jgi:hypothetical protein
MPVESSSASLNTSRGDDRLRNRVAVSLAPLATALAMQHMQHVAPPPRARLTNGARFSPLQPVVTNLPVLRIAW